MSFDDAEAALSILKDINYERFSSLASEELDYIEVEHDGEEGLLKAEELFEEGDYSGALADLVKIDCDYSQYGSVSNFYEECVELLLIMVSEPSTVEEYDEFISKMDEYTEISGDKRFADRKKLLVDEKPDFEKAFPFIQESESQFNSNKYGDSFETLEMALGKNPKNRFISEKLDEYHNIFIVKILTDVAELLEKEDYDAAIELIYKGKDVYECEEFNDARIAIKKQQSAVARFVYNTLDYFNTIGGKWISEEFDAQKTVEDGIEYIAKSGKKLILGDYDKEHVTVLSFTGNILASLAGLDIGLDLRDLTYDITHVDDEEYMALFLATDVVALVPVIGMTKYIKNVQICDKMPKALTKLLDAGSDASKSVSEIFERASKQGKTADQVEYFTKALSNHNTPEVVLNKDLDVKIHPKTGVKLVKKKYVYTDGKVVEDYFPEFDSYCDVNLPREIYKSARATHNNHCTMDLAEQIKNNPNLRKKFTDNQIKQIEAKQLPKEFVWHHSEKEGLMQLVDSETHGNINHQGGFSLWGKEADKK